LVELVCAKLLAVPTTKTDINARRKRGRKTLEIETNRAAFIKDSSKWWKLPKLRYSKSQDTGDLSDVELFSP
jgi:hypothetical protein